MKKIMTATINPCTETTGEYRLSEAHEAEFGHEWDGNIRAYILNASEDEDAAREAMAREYTGAIHDLPAGAGTLQAHRTSHSVKFEAILTQESSLCKYFFAIHSILSQKVPFDSS